MPTKPCEKCGAQTELMYKTQIPGGTVDHHICIDCLEKLMVEMVEASPRFRNPDADAKRGFQTAGQFIQKDEAITMILEWAEIRLLNIGTQNHILPYDSHPMFLVIVESIYNRQHHAQPYYPTWPKDIITDAFRYLKADVFKDSKYCEDMV